MTNDIDKPTSDEHGDVYTYRMKTPDSDKPKARILSEGEVEGYGDKGRWMSDMEPTCVQVLRISHESLRAERDDLRTKLEVVSGLDHPAPGQKRVLTDVEVSGLLKASADGCYLNTQIAEVLCASHLALAERRRGLEKVAEAATVLLPLLAGCSAYSSMHAAEVNNATQKLRTALASLTPKEGTQ